MFFATTIRRTPERADSYILILSFREHSSSWQRKDGGGTRVLLSGQEVETNECQYPGVFSFSSPPNQVHEITQPAFRDGPFTSIDPC